MSADAKKLLSSTIRSLRDRLITDLNAATESTYRLSVSERDAALAEQWRLKRRRLEAWITEVSRAESGRGKSKRDEDAIRQDVAKQAAYTLLNRLVILRLLEAAEMQSPKVVTGGWESQGYKDFRSLAPGIVRGDETEGYAYLLQLIFSDLASDLPGLFGPAGIAELVPIPPATLRFAIESLDSEGLTSCWSDDMTLGWIYQYWNDPERESLDDKLNSGGKLAPHEIASKTQMFTERYMADWLLHNSLGPLWFRICRRNGWVPEVEADGTLDRLESRRQEWRDKRRVEAVSLTDTMPLLTDSERRWAYYIPCEPPESLQTKTPASIRDVTIIDPAVGSGHFLIVLFDLLLALYREESRHRQQEREPEWTTRSIVERILEHNLHGVDLDPRAVQIAAAALWLKARRESPQAQPRRMNLVAANLNLSRLPESDPAVAELRRELEVECGIPAALTDTLVGALKGADTTGSLLRIDATVDAAIAAHERAYAAQRNPETPSLFDDDGEHHSSARLNKQETRASVIDRLESFLGRHTGGDDLGLRLRGEQIASGVRFIRILREARYDLVVGNPPYQGTAKMQDASYVTRQYPLGKYDLYAAFLIRALELAREGGISALLTMRNWMFTKQYIALRKRLTSEHTLMAIGDFAVGAFDEVANDRLSVAVTVFAKVPPSGDKGVAQMPTPANDKSYDRERTKRKRAATLAHEGLYGFEIELLKAIPWSPFIYWWPDAFLRDYLAQPKYSEANPVRQGMGTSDNARFLRKPWEVSSRPYPRATGGTPPQPGTVDYAPYVKGAAGVVWFEPLQDIIRWQHHGLEVKVYNQFLYRSYTRKIKNEAWFFRPGVAFAPVGSSFTARAHRYLSICDDMGSSVYPACIPSALAALNCKKAQFILESLNPTIHFNAGDVNRLPVISIPDSELIYSVLDTAFSKHEATRESSVEFIRPGSSTWSAAQAWAQQAVDRPEGEPLAVFEPSNDPEPPSDHISYAMGRALGRFGLDGLVPSTGSLPDGILFLDGALEPADYRDSLGHPAAACLRDAWSTFGPSILDADSLRDYLRLKLFAVHKSDRMYDNRPIYWPLSSANKLFVAWISIHRWAERPSRY